MLLSHHNCLTFLKIFVVYDLFRFESKGLPAELWCRPGLTGTVWQQQHHLAGDHLSLPSSLGFLTMIPKCATVTKTQQRTSVLTYPPSLSLPKSYYVLSAAKFVPHPGDETI